jgi:hypothetical protein
VLLIKTGFILYLHHLPRYWVQITEIYCMIKYLILLLPLLSCGVSGWKGGDAGAGPTTNNYDSVPVMPVFTGVWAGVGDENAAFLITDSTIEYPEHGSYSYRLVGDSIAIQYDGYEMRFEAKLKGADTLLMSGDTRQVFYRFK